MTAKTDCPIGYRWSNIGFNGTEWNHPKLAIGCAPAKQEVTFLWIQLTVASQQSELRVKVLDKFFTCPATCMISLEQGKCFRVGADLPNSQQRQSNKCDWRPVPDFLIWHYFIQSSGSQIFRGGVYTARRFNAGNWQWGLSDDYWCVLLSCRYPGRVQRLTYLSSKFHQSSVKLYDLLQLSRNHKRLQLTLGVKFDGCVIIVVGSRLLPLTMQTAFFRSVEEVSFMKIFHRAQSSALYFNILHSITVRKPVW